MASQAAGSAEYDPNTLRKGEYGTPDREYPSTTHTGGSGTGGTTGVQEVPSTGGYGSGDSNDNAGGISPVA